MQYYIEKKYSKLIHTIPFVDILFKKADNLGSLILQDRYNYKRIFITTPKNTKINSKIKNYIDIYKNTTKRYTFYPITSFTAFNRNENDKHSLFIIYDKKFNQIELFDSGYDNLEPFKSQVKLFFKEIYGNEITLIYQDHTKTSIGEIFSKNCDDKKNNYTSTSGFCVIFTLWQLETILQNSKFKLEQIRIKIYKMLNKLNICSIIFGYSQFVDNFVIDYEPIFTKKGLRIELFK
jgi:hypothetical protein